MTLHPAEVVLIRMRFHQTQGSKVRPALVLLDTSDEDFVAAPITSHPRQKFPEWFTVDENKLYKLTGSEQVRLGSELIQGAPLTAGIWEIAPNQYQK